MLDGVIIVNTLDQPQTLAFLELEEESISAVLIDCLATPNIPSVRIDNFEAAYLATHHAIELGHQCITHIAGSATVLMAQQRQQSYLQALTDHGLTYQQIVVSPHGRWDFQAGYDTMRELLTHVPLPTAVFATSDQDGDWGLPRYR